MWRVIKIVCPNFTMRYECASMCRRAVDRSQGKHTDLTIACVGDDELLDFIVNRSGNLRSLTIACPYYVSATALTEAVKKLHLILPPILSGDIETIGVSCPKLKSFSFNKILSENRLLDFLDGLTPPSNVDAAAIAKNMPNLCHLGILGNELNNEGLEAILDGCPCLESLDLRCCFLLDLGGALGHRCRDKIKYLRLLFDSVGDYEWKDAVQYSDYIPVGNVSSDVDFSFGCYGYVFSDSDSVCSEADGSAASVCSEVDSDNDSGSVCSEVDFDNSSGSVCSEVDSDNGSGSVCSEVDTDNGLSCSGEVVCVGSGLILHDFEQREDPSPRFDSGGDYYWSGRCDFDDDLGLGNDYNDNFEYGNNYDD